uniref:Uncharacterized protein n=1 Tax=Arundo donax TaxID=35708 RepID=A0A0A9CHX1_ARUDO
MNKETSNGAKYGHCAARQHCFPIRYSRRWIISRGVPFFYLAMNKR